MISCTDLIDQIPADPLFEKQKNPVPICIGTGFCVYERNSRLDDGDVRRLEPFRALLDFELHIVTFVQGFETPASDGFIVDEHIFATRA